MEIKWESETVKLDKYAIDIKKIRSVKKIDVAFKNVNIPFLCVQIGQNKWNFYYADLNTYEQLIQLIAGETSETSKFLKKYESIYNEMHALWKLLVCTTIGTFNLNQYEYIDKVGFSVTSDYIDSDIIYHDDMWAHQISSISDAYSCLISVLPENIETTRKLVQEKKREEEKKWEEAKKKEAEERKRLMQKYADLIEEKKKREEEKKKEEKEEKRKRLIQEYADRKNEINNILEPSDSDYYLLLKRADLKQELQTITDEISYWETGINLEAVDQEWSLLRINVLRHKSEIINRTYEEKLSEKLEDQYGTIEELKTDLLKIINGLVFKDALSFFHQYRNIEQELKYNKDADEFKEALKPYDLYIEFYQNAGIFVSNYLNEINKYKAKRVSIPQSKVNAALMYMYNAHTVEEAYELQQQKDYIENRSFGERGEAEVDYALKWLVGDYIRIVKTQSGKYGEQAIVLNNKEFIDEPQEFDHIVIGTQGIFNIETKNYTGKLIVDANGNWIRVKADGSEIGERNPIQQVRRHEAVLKSIVGEDVPIISVLVMANPKMIIEGVENFSIPLLKSDRLEEFISTYKNEKLYTKSEMVAIYEKLEQYRVSK